MKRITLMFFVMYSLCATAQTWQTIISDQSPQVWRKTRQLAYLNDGSYFVNSSTNYNKCLRKELFAYSGNGDYMWSVPTNCDFIATNKMSNRIVSVGFDSPKDVFGLEKMPVKVFSQNGNVLFDSIYDVSYNSSNLAFFSPEGVSLSDNGDMLIFGGKTTVLLNSDGDVQYVNHLRLNSAIKKSDFILSGQYYLISTEKELFMVKPYSHAVDTISYSNTISQWYVNSSNEVVVLSDNKMDVYTTSAYFDLKESHDLASINGAKTIQEGGDGLIFTSLTDSLKVYQITNQIEMRSSMPSYLWEVKFFYDGNGLLTFVGDYRNEQVYAFKQGLYFPVAIQNTDVSISKLQFEKDMFSVEEAYYLYAFIENTGSVQIDSFYLASNMYADLNCKTPADGRWVYQKLIVGATSQVFFDTIPRTIIDKQEICLQVSAINAGIDVDTVANTACVNGVVTSAQEISVENIQITPNPASDVVSITGLASNSKVEILNTMGQVLFSDFNFRASQQLVISDFGKGQFLVKITKNETVVTKVLIVE